MRSHRHTVEGHAEISGLIPWYVNGTATEADRLRVEEHLRACPLCRDDLQYELRVYAGMSVDTGVEYMPAASLKNLMTKLDAGEISMEPAALASTPQRPLRRAAWWSWRRSMAASVALCALAIAFAAWTRFRADGIPAVYHTVTAAEIRPPDEVIRAVFVPTTSLAELQSMLDEAQLRIISGPTEAGVYSLASSSQRPASSSLARLRRHTAVRFAESTQTEVTGKADGSSSTPP